MKPMLSGGARTIKDICAESAPISPNKAMKFAPVYGLRWTVKPLRDLSAAYRWRWASKKQSQVLRMDGRLARAPDYGMRNGRSRNEYQYDKIHFRPETIALNSFR
ncbi:MAG: hypothetical protein GKR94_02785 [Gammaproteobacteria bacterium]|nr:hypothetical protein [Gammaproteobacteria bacterium]